MSLSAQPQQEFENLCEETLRKVGSPGGIERDAIIEDLGFQFEFADQYVAWINVVERVDGRKRYRRRVLAHSPDLKELNAALDAYSPRERRYLCLDFIDPPSELQTAKTSA